MDPRTQERVEQWDSRPVGDGFDGLSNLASTDFSGAVAAGSSWLFMLNGRVVGVVGGTVDDFERASGTAYDAPHPSLPLLSVMEARSGEPRAKYYTNDTPLEEVDETLQQGSFTGYVELSENVLSGDYYAVYYGGRRMAAAYVGNAERLFTGEEAFERAADEVGIYRVFDVDLEVTDVPTSADGGADQTTDESDDGAVDGVDVSPGAVDAAVDDSSSDAPADDVTAPGVEEPSLEEPTTDPAADASTAAAASDASPAGEESAADGSTADGGAAVDPVDDPEEVPAPPETEPESEPEPPESDHDPAESPADDAPDDPELAEIEAAAEELDRKDISWVDEDDEPPTGPEAEGDSGQRFQQEEQWRETRSIPSIDPDNSETIDSDSDAADPGEQSAPRRDGDDSSETATAASGRTSPDERRRRAEHPSTEPREPGADEEGRAQDARRQQTTDEDEEGTDDRRERIETLESERDELQSKNRELASTVEQLRSRIEELEAELAEARAGEATGAGLDGGVRLSRQEALDRTNLFVRYESKSQPTLQSAHDGDADREAVAANLQLVHHTEFDAADAVVDGDPYEETLRATMEYRFVAWLTETLLHEIRDTGHADALGDLYDAIPSIDRAELDATISLEDDDTEDVPDQVRFDVVAYDKMGTPQVVVNINDSRVPASQGMLETMEEDASAVKANYPDLAAAFVVTSSYFEPGALEVTERATNGGFLSRSSKLSYVNLSRKQGYHLCLAESRSEGFYMTVPEL